MKVLAIVHVYYHSMWDELERCLLNIAADDDLTLLLTLSSPSPKLEQRIKECFPGVRIELVANKGYDIWPFLQMLELVNLDDFDLLVKLHTKREMNSRHGMKGVWTPGSVWRDNLLSFCRTLKNWTLTKVQFTQPRVGMVSHELNCYGRQHDYCQFHYPDLNNILNRMGFDMPSNGRFVAGAMFAARPHLFKPFRGLYQEEDFLVPDKTHTEGLPHQLERILGLATCAQGFTIGSFDGTNIRQKELVRNVLRFFWYRQRTSSHVRLRLLGIPVWQRRITKQE